METPFGAYTRFTVGDDILPIHTPCVTHVPIFVFGDLFIQLVSVSHEHFEEELSSMSGVKKNEICWNNVQWIR